MAKFPAPVYAETVLGPNFEHAKLHFLDALIQIHYAHTIMLAKQGIVTAKETRVLLEALGGLHRKRIQGARYDGSFEDLFFFVETMLEEACGREIAGKMHTARSRNDIAVTLYRMTARQAVLGLETSILELRAVLLNLAGQHLETVMPAHTHTQPAQPTTLAHYLLAACEFLGRDGERLRGAFGRMNLCPMGAAALTTTGFAIDREYTARLLGFEGTAENSYGAIASIDYITEAAGVVAVAMVNAGKLIRICCCGQRASSDSCACRMGSCNRRASCRRSAIQWRWNTRGFWRAGRWARRRPCCCARTTLPSATSTIVKTTCSRW